VRKQNLRKVGWSSERMRAFVTRDGVRYFATEETCASAGDDVQVFNPDGKSVTVKCGDVRETWRADATSPGEGG
jgi:hypothetical protein